MNLGVPLIILLLIICSCKAVKIRFGELDYITNEGDGVAKIVLVVSESPSQPVTIPIIVKSFDEYFGVDNNTLPSDFNSMTLPDKAEYSIDGSGRRDFVKNGTIEITFPPSGNIQEREVLISLVDDQINEALEGFLVLVDVGKLFIPEEVIDIVRGGVTLVRIEDNDPISLMFEQREYTMSEQDGDLPNTIMVTKGGVESEQELQVVVQRSQFTSAGANIGTDFDIEDVTNLRFLPSDSTLPVPFTIINDDIPEEIETFSLFLSVVETVAGFSLGNPSGTEIKIVDDDAFVVGFEQLFYTIIEGETHAVCVQIKEPETIGFLLPSSIESRDGTATLENGDYEQVSKIVLLPDPDGTMMNCIEVVTNDNDEINPSRDFMIELSFISEAPPNAMTDIHSTTIVIADNDLARDPCASNNCHADADCYSDGSDTIQCICRSGFTGNGMLCIDICSEGANACHAQADCIKTDNPEGYQCVCQSGFTGNGMDCIDICSEGANACHAPAACIKTDNPEGYVCVCQDGNIGNGMDCIDVCSEGANDCHAQADCIKTDNPEGFQCVCQSGFTGNGMDCIEICSDGANDCHAQADCIKTNTPEGYQCVCQSGFTGNGMDCIEICSDGANDCHAQADCIKTNTPEGYQCVCQSGFTGNGMDCIVITDPPTSPSTELPICGVEKDDTESRSTSSYSTGHRDHLTGRHHHHHHHHSNRGRHHSHGRHHRHHSSHGGHRHRHHLHGHRHHHHSTDRDSSYSHATNSASSRSHSSSSNMPCVEGPIPDSFRSSQSRSRGPKSRSSRRHRSRENTRRSRRRGRSNRRVRGQPMRRG